MSEKHTPGPWWVSGDKPGETAPIFPVVRGMKDGTTRITVARIGNNNHYSKNSIDHKNARLIAAAPDLLEALIEIMSWEDNDRMTWADKARAAITKATGAAS